MTFWDRSARPASVRMQTLNTLRWLAIVGQVVALLVASWAFGLDLPLDLTAVVIAVSATFTIGTTLVYPPNLRLSPRDALLTLLFDLSQLGAMLFLTGGLNNPFAVLMLAQTIISATVLSLSATVTLGGATLVLFALLSQVYLPLRDTAGALIVMPGLLIGGMWASLSVAVLFLGIFAWRVTHETYSMAEALAATQLALERERKLTALGGVVAAAAHELGTPLATIKLVSTELAQELADRPELREDAALIGSQAERCRAILQDMGRSGKVDAITRTAPFQVVIEEAAAPHVARGIDVFIRTDGGADGDEDDDRDQPIVPRHPEIVHGVRNLVQNAVDFAKTSVWIDLTWDANTIRVTVGDDGVGFPADLLGRIGDPFVRRRFSLRATEALRPEYQGMGLGLFIAKTLLERTGARLTFVNGRRSQPEGDALPAAARRPTGAIVELVWDRFDLEVDGRREAHHPGDAAQSPAAPEATLPSGLPKATG